MREHLRTGSLICPGLDVLFFLFLFLLMLPLAIGHVSQSRAVEGTGTVRPLPGAQEAGSVSAQESWQCTGWGNRLLMSGTTSPLWSFSCLAHLCPWPHASFPESLWMARITPITAAREADLRLSTPGGESCSCARNRGGPKTRGGRDPLPGYKFGKSLLWAFLLA